MGTLRGLQHDLVERDRSDERIVMLATLAARLEAEAAALRALVAQIEEESS